MDDVLTFADENLPADLHQGPPWKILIADDEPSVHLVTKLALGDFTFEGRRLDLLSAYGEDDTRRLLTEHPDIALILLDVVMDTMDSGFDLVRYIRDELKNKDVRIIMRTGQSGNAPEDRIIISYDINDFKDKTELTVAKLRTTMISSLRTYSHLKIIAEEQQKASASRAYLHSVIDSLSSVLIAVDRDLKVLLWNHEAELWLGIPARDAAGRALFEVAPALEPLQGLFRELAQGVPGGRLERSSVPLWKGGQVFVHLILQALQGGGGPETLIRLDDRTLARHLDEQVSRSQRVNAFSTLAAGVTRELSRLLDRPQIDAPGLRDWGLRATSLLDRLARFTPPTPSVRENLDWAEVLRQTLAARTFPDTVRVRVETPSVEARVAAGRPGLETLVENLIENALEAVPGTVEVSLVSRDLAEADRARHPEASPGPYWVLTVRDHGVGMSAEALRRVFDPSYTTKPHGLGLGLPLVYSVAESLGGFVELTSEPGAGTDVRVSLPAWRPAGGGARSGMVLLCDDEPLMRQVAGRILRHLGYEVVEASDGPSALDQFNEHQGELRAVILDLVLPGTPGLEVFRQIREKSPGIPVILSSGFGRSGVVDQALSEGVTAFLQKPYRAEALAETVRTALAQASG